MDKYIVQRIFNIFEINFLIMSCHLLCMLIFLVANLLIVRAYSVFTIQYLHEYDFIEFPMQISTEHIDHIFKTQ